jgi:flagellar L-ring protein precursor FlgH
VAPPRTGQRLSLYADDSFQSLTSDRRIHRVGDLITVMIFESASASSTADTGSARDANVGMSVTRPNKGGVSAGLGTNNDFTGTGRTQREGKILAQLTVSVREVLPNQDLMLSGEQLLEINGEKQIIRLEGRARPRDISELNTVVSTRIADAKIAFIGDGVVGDRQKPGWWQQLLGVFGL